MDNQQDYKKYNHSEAIKDQIQRVNQLISEMDTETSQGFKQYYSKVFMGLASLDALVDPFRGEDDESFMDDADTSGSREEKLQFIHETMKDLMNFLDEENIFYARRTGRTEV